MDDIVRFNVGGVAFSTTRATLTRHDANALASFVESGDETSLDGTLVRLKDGTIFIDRDSDLFSLILNFLRTGKVHLDNGTEVSRLRDEALFYGVNSLAEQLAPSADSVGGHITLGYRGTFAYGRDGQADVKFRKLQRILVHGKAALCKEVFGDTLNESRDPGDHDGADRYTARLYLKHQCLEKACDAMAEKGFKLIATCTSGANGLMPNHQLVTSSLSANSQNDMMNQHRNSGDHEEQRWAHYTEYVFYRAASTLLPNTVNNTQNGEM